MIVLLRTLNIVVTLRRRRRSTWTVIVSISGTFLLGIVITGPGEHLRSRLTGLTGRRLAREGGGRGLYPPGVLKGWRLPREGWLTGLGLYHRSSGLVPGSGDWGHGWGQQMVGQGLLGLGLVLLGGQQAGGQEAVVLVVLGGCQQ